MTRYFRDYPARTGDRMLFKMEHYLELYDELLATWQGHEVSFLEIGVYKGGSLPMWQGYFAPTSRLTFCDIDPACQALALPGATVEIGDQADAGFLEQVARTHGPFDLIDRMHSWYTEDDAGFPLHPLAREIGGIRFHDSLVVIEKRLKEAPVAITAQNGQVGRSRRMLEVRGRRSIF